MIIKLYDGSEKTEVSLFQIDPRQQLETVRRLRVVQFEYSPEVAKSLGLRETTDTGIIAQELLSVLPDAVQTTGEFAYPVDNSPQQATTSLSTEEGGENMTRIPNFLVVNKDRIFMENVGAVKVS